MQKQEPVVYVDDGYGDSNFQNNVDVSISLSESDWS